MQELLPNCNKVRVPFSIYYSWFYIVLIILISIEYFFIFFSEFLSDRASVLDDAVNYLKTLKSQVKVRNYSAESHY